MPHKAKNDIVQISAQDLASLFQGKQLSNASTVTWIRSIDFQTQLYLDPNFNNIWLRDRQLLIDKPLSFNDFLLAEDHEDVIIQVSNRNKGYESGQTIFRIVRPDGEIRWIKDNSYYIFDNKNSAFAVLGIAESISPDEWHTIRQQNKQANKVAFEESPFEKVLHDLLKASNRFISKSITTKDKNNILGGELYNLVVAGQNIFLSKRETDCLKCLIRGMTAKETAKMLEISPRTVETYLDNMKAKTKSANKLELIAKLGGLA